MVSAMMATHRYEGSRRSTEPLGYRPAQSAAAWADMQVSTYSVVSRPLQHSSGEENTPSEDPTVRSRSTWHLSRRGLLRNTNKHIPRLELDEEHSRSAIRVLRELPRLLAEAAPRDVGTAHAGKARRRT